jgi:hypothetical protein
MAAASRYPRTGNELLGNSAIPARSRTAGRGRQEAVRSSPLRRDGRPAGGIVLRLAKRRCAFCSKAGLRADPPVPSRDAHWPYRNRSFFGECHEPRVLDTLNGSDTAKSEYASSATGAALLAGAGQRLARDRRRPLAARRPTGVGNAERRRVGVGPMFCCFSVRPPARAPCFLSSSVPSATRRGAGQHPDTSTCGGSLCVIAVPKNESNPHSSGPGLSSPFQSGSFTP